MKTASHQTIIKKGLYGYEICKLLGKVKRFVGVYSRDRIPTPTVFPSFAIVNTDASSGPGEHWVALGFYKDHIEYFDSFGLPPMHLSFTNGYKKIQWNSVCIQEVKSLICGYYCILYVVLRAKRISFERILNHFSTTKLEENTFTLFKLLKHHGLQRNRSTMYFRRDYANGNHTVSVSKRRGNSR